MQNVNREFNIGDYVITKDGLQDVANGQYRLVGARKKVLRISEFEEDGNVVFIYVLEKGTERREGNLFPIRDAKKMVMKILAERMQDVAGMEG